jgi:hypothetical protein
MAKCLMNWDNFAFSSVAVPIYKRSLPPTRLKLNFHRHSQPHLTELEEQVSVRLQLRSRVAIVRLCYSELFIFVTCLFPVTGSVASEHKFEVRVNPHSWLHENHLMMLFGEVSRQQPDTRKGRAFLS